jgi:hypothetical protein
VGNHSLNRVWQRSSVLQLSVFEGFDGLAEGFFGRGTLTVGDCGKRAINEPTGSLEAGNATTTFH